MKRWKHNVLFFFLFLLGAGGLFLPVQSQAATTRKAPDLNVVRNSYYRFVKSGRYLKYTNNRRCQGFGVTENDRYGGMADLDKDKIPELILVKYNKYEEPKIYYIFTWKKGKVKFVKEIRSNYKYGTLSLENHRSRPYLYTEDHNLYAMFELLLDALSEEDEKAFMKKFENGLTGITFSQVTSLFRIMDAKMSLKEKESSRFEGKGTEDGVAFYINGKHWMQIAVSLNDQSVFKCKLTDKKFRFGVLSVKIWQEGKADVELRMDFGKRTMAQLEKLLDTKTDKQLARMFPVRYYSKDKKISEKKADQIMASYENRDPDLELDKATNNHKNYDEIDVISNKEKNWKEYLGKAPNRIKLSYTWIRLRVEQDYPIRVTVYPKNASNVCVYTSSHPEVASVYGNRIYAYKKGKTVITVRSRLNKNAWKRIRVTVL